MASPVTIADNEVHNETSATIAHIWVSGDLKGGVLHVRSKPAGLGTYVDELLEDQIGPIKYPGHWALSLPSPVDVQFQVLGSREAPSVTVHYA